MVMVVPSLHRTGVVPRSVFNPDYYVFFDKRFKRLVDSSCGNIRIFFSYEAADLLGRGMVMKRLTASRTARR